jgi:hypothetical protein
VVAGGGMTVTGVVSGTNTEYSVEIESTLLTKLNSLLIDSLVAGTGISIANSTSGNTKTWTITNSVSGKDEMYTRVSLDLSSGAGSDPTVAYDEEVLYGTSFQKNSSGSTFGAIHTGGNWATNNATFIYKTLGSVGTRFYADVDIIEHHFLGDTAFDVDDRRPIGINIMNIGSNQVSVSFVDPSGTPVNGQDLSSNFDKIILQFKFFK